MYSKSVSVLSTGASTQDITFTPNGSDPSWTPKIAIVQWNRANTSQNTWQEHASVGMGFTDGTNQRCVCTSSEDNQARGDTGNIQSNDSLITALSPTSTVTDIDAVATFNSWLTNGMRINWTDAPAANFYFYVLFLGGDDITNVSVGTLLTGTGTGTISETGLAYQPQVGLFITGGTATQNTATSGGFLCNGAATSSSAQWGQGIYAQDNPATMLTNQWYSHTNLIATFTNAGLTGLAAFSAFTSNGFELNVSDAFPASYPIYYLVIRGGSFAVGNATEPASLITQTITTNKNTKAVGIFGLDIGTADTVSTGCMLSLGFSDSAYNQFFTMFEDQNAAANSIVVSRTNTGSVYVNMTANVTATSSTIDDYANITSVTSTGFDITWYNIGNARPFRYLTFGDSTAQLYYGTIDDEPSVSVSESTTRSAIQTKSITDPSQNISELLDSIAIHTRPLSDTSITTSEDIFRLRSIMKTLDESAISVGAGVVDPYFTAGRTIAEPSVFVSESLDVFGNFLRSITTEDAVTISELITSGIVYSALISNEPQVTVSDTLESIANYLRSITNEGAISTSELISITKHITSLILDTPVVSVSDVVTGTRVPILYSVHLYEFPETVEDAVTAVLNPIYQVIKTSGIIFDIGTGVEVAKQATIIFSMDSQPVKQFTMLSDIVHAIPAKTSTLRHSIESETTKILTILQDIKKDVTLTGTIRYNLTQLAQKTNTLLQHVIAETTKTNTVRFDIEHELYVTKTATLIFHVRLDMTKPLTVLANIQAQAVKMNTFLFELRQKAEEQIVVRFDETGQAIKSLTLRFNTLQEMTLASTWTLLFDVKSLVLKTNTLLQDIRQELTPAKQLTLLQHIRLDVTKARTLLYDVRESLTKISTMRYDLRQASEQSNALLFGIIQEITEISNLLFNIEQIFVGQVVKTSILPFHVKQDVVKSISMLFNEMQDIIQTNTFLFDLRNSAMKQGLFRWNQRGEAVNDLTLIFNVMLNVEKLNSLLVNIVNQVTDTNILRFDVAQKAEQILDLLFDIQGIPGVVIKTLSLLQDIRVSLTRDSTIRYNITKLVEKTNTLIQQIFRSAIKQGVFRYSVRHEAVDTNTIRFNITTLVEKTNSIIFNEMVSIAKQNSILFATLKQTVKPEQLKFNIISETVKANNLVYDIKEFTSKSITLDQQIAQKAETDVTVRYDVISQIARSLTLQQQIMEALSKQNSLLYSIAQEIPELDVTLKFDLISQTTKLLRTLYDVRQVFDWTRRLVYNIYPQDITPKVTLHEKLLDFIISQYTETNPRFDEILWHEWYNGQRDITVESIFINHVPIPQRSTVIYKERKYICGIHIFYRDYSDVLPENRNTPLELANLIKEIQRILLINRYNLYNEFGRYVYEVRVKDAKFVPEPKLTESSSLKIWHYRFTVEMYYQKLIV